MQEEERESARVGRAGAMLAKAGVSCMECTLNPDELTHHLKDEATHAQTAIARDCLSTYCNK